MILFKILKGIQWRSNRYLKSKAIKRKIKKNKLTELKLHLGCGGHKLKNYINVDYKLSKTIDLRIDLNYPDFFPENSIDHVFSNAFYEHLFRSHRIIHLKYFYQALNPDGFVCYIGIPYFKEVARLYLRGETYFNLDNVFRFTHGGGGIEKMNPDSKKTLFFADLHKSLYDEKEIKYCLEKSGFEYFLIFKYCHPGEENFPINIGFYATKSFKDDIDMKNNCKEFLFRFNNEKLLINTLLFIE